MNNGRERILLEYKAGTICMKSLEMVDYLIANSHATEGSDVLPFLTEKDYSCLVLVIAPLGK